MQSFQQISKVHKNNKSQKISTAQKNFKEDLKNKKRIYLNNSTMKIFFSSKNGLNDGPIEFFFLFRRDSYV